MYKLCIQIHTLLPSHMVYTILIRAEITNVYKKLMQTLYIIMCYSETYIFLVENQFSVYKLFAVMLITVTRIDRLFPLNTL